MNLRIPGPMPLPDHILELAGRQMIDHRGPEFKVIIERMTEAMKTVLETSGDVYFLSCSGTGAMEAAIVNTLSPGSSVLSISIGVFGDRFADIAEAYGAVIDRMSVEPGKAADPEEVRDRLKSMPRCNAVLVTQNDTSTGTANDLEDLCRVIHDESDALILVDAVSSAGATPVPMDAWGIDMVATASQKAWMAPPGIAMLGVSAKAWEANFIARMPRFYFDIEKARHFLEIGQTPFTPALSTIFALDRSLQEMTSEGMGPVYERHRSRAAQARAGIKQLGLQLFPDEAAASETVTAVRTPEGVDAKRLVERMRTEHDVVISGGQQALAGKIFRIGHMGWCEPEHIDDCLEALGKTLAALRA